MLFISLHGKSHKDRVGIFLGFRRFEGLINFAQREAMRDQALGIDFPGG